MSVGYPLAGPDLPPEQPPLRLFDPGSDVAQRTLVQKACDVIGPSAVGDEYFSDAAHDCLSVLLEAPRGMHDESVWRMANHFLSRLFDVIGVIERLDPNAPVLQELHHVRRRCIRTFPDAFTEPTFLL